MLDDRDYMRSKSRPGWSFAFHWSATTILLVVIAACFCLQQLIPEDGVEKYLSLSLAGLSHGFVLQLLTFQFLHAGVLHLFFNLVALWSFGRVVEDRLGVSRYLWMYFLTGVVGGLLQIAQSFLIPAMHDTYLFGASAGICGVIAVFCRLEPEMPIIPLFIKARYALLVFIGVALFFTFITIGPGISHAAHLGGLLAGVAWVKLGWHRDYIPLPWENLLGRLRFWRSAPARQRKQELVPTAARSRPWRSAGADVEPDVAPEEFISREVDPILDKISAQGIQSLTERERKILADAQKKMAKR